MPDSERRRSRVATCEDWDEVAQTTLPGSRTTANANVAVKRSEQDLAGGRIETKVKMNGVDSGYVSRADTIVSEPTSVRRKTHDSKNEPPAGVIERERQPYSMAQAAPQTTPVKPTVRRQPSSRSKDIYIPEQLPNKSRQVHESGICQVCDRFGWHDPREISKIAAVAAQQPPSPTATRTVAVGRSKDDDALIPKTRRSSSMRQSRPLSVVTNPANPQPFVQSAMYATPVFATAPAWSTPATPIQYAQPLPAYTYAAAPAPTPGAPQYGPYPTTTQAYFDPVSIPEPRSLQPSRRSSPTRRATLYGDPVINQSHNSSYPALERVPSHENRPSIMSHKSQRSIDQDRMPPPPKPQSQEASLSRRPSNRRSKAYIQEDPPRQRPAHESSRYEKDYDEYIEMPPTSLHRSRRESSTLPPTSYRGPTVVESRPVLPRKTVSYSTAETTMKVASSKTSSHRRTTLPSMTLEQKEAEAEAYQRKNTSATHHLTPEALRVLEKGSAGSRSETGSSYSHKSQQSSSKDSSRGRSQTHSSATATNITFGGVHVSIPANFKSERPVSINLGDVTLTMNKPPDKEPDRHREQKRIERAPSVTSKTSRRSIASSNVSSNDIPKKTSRRTSQLEERVKPSRQHSRAPSATGVSYEYTTVSKKSVDPTKYEDFYGA